MNYALTDTCTHAVFIQMHIPGACEEWDLYSGVIPYLDNQHYNLMVHAHVVSMAPQCLFIIIQVKVTPPDVV